jgi:peptide/nickel transport system substrate-binding protein
MVKPMPGKVNAPCLAQSWSMSEDGLTWDFILRDGMKFHNGEPITAEDVKFSFKRYRGANQGLIKQQVAAIEAFEAQQVRFRLFKSWPDFVTFYYRSRQPLGQRKSRSAPGLSLEAPTGIWIIGLSVRSCLMRCWSRS